MFFFLPTDKILRCGKMARCANVKYMSIFYIVCVYIIVCIQRKAFWWLYCEFFWNINNNSCEHLFSVGWRVDFWAIAKYQKINLYHLWWICVTCFIQYFQLIIFKNETRFVESKKFFFLFLNKNFTYLYCLSDHESEAGFPQKSTGL